MKDPKNPMKYGSKAIAPCHKVRTMSAMNETSPRKSGKMPVRKTRIINFTIVVDYDTNKWEDDLFGIEIELSSRLFGQNEDCHDVQVMRTSTLGAFDLE